MGKLPILTAREIIPVLKRLGFVEDRQKGSHLIFYHATTKVRTMISVHAGVAIKRSHLRHILSGAKVSEEEFLKLL